MSSKQLETRNRTLSAIRESPSKSCSLQEENYLFLREASPP